MAEDSIAGDEVSSAISFRLPCHAVIQPVPAARVLHPPYETAARPCQDQAGEHVAPYLAARGYQVTIADLAGPKHPAVADLRVDLTDAGETYSALARLATVERARPA